jgi:RNA polymerase sigma factor (sigma-70 family)
MPWHPGGRRAARGEERLAQRAGEGDTRAFTALYERYHQRLYRYCLSILRDDADAQDALQSTFERALGALRRGQRNAPLRPWLFRIAHNEAISVIRRRAPDQALEPLGVTHAHSAEHVAAERDRLATLVADLAQLPDQARSALVMRELQGLSHEDIAIALQSSVGAAKQAIFEARRGLAEAARGREMSCEDIRQLVSDGDRRVLRARRVGAHLRSCGPCADFARAIRQRRADLRALAPPLAPIAAASILARASGGLGAHGTSGGLGAVGAGTGTLGKGALAAALSSKVAVGAAVLATATAGVAGVAVLKPLFHPHRAGSPAVRSSASPRSVRGASAGARPGATPQPGASGASVRAGRGATVALAQSGHRGRGRGSSAASTAGRSSRGFGRQGAAVRRAGHTATPAGRGLGARVGTSRGNAGSHGGRAAARAPAQSAAPASKSRSAKSRSAKPRAGKRGAPRTSRRTGNGSPAANPTTRKIHR